VGSDPVFRGAASEVVRLSAIDIDGAREEIGGWHGTSLEAIVHALRLGALAPSAVAHGDATPGHLFFYPATPFDFDPRNDFATQLHGRGGAIQHAEGSAAYHYLFKRCRLDFQNEDHHLLVMEAVDCMNSGVHGRYTREALEELGIGARRQREVIHAAHARKGFLIALTRDALTEWAPSAGDQPGIDEKIFVPGGLPFRAIAAIQPLGSVERAFVKELRESVEGKAG
jgi:hypothetical protein